MNPYASGNPHQPGDDPRYGPFNAGQDPVSPWPETYWEDRQALNPYAQEPRRTEEMRRPPSTYAPPVPSSPRITPQTVAAAEQLGYDPTVVNAPIVRRFSALLIDMAIYLVAVAGLIGISGIAGGAEGALIASIVAGVLGPVGFYGYRSAGDAIFEGSPGKRMLGLSMGGPHNLPVSGGAGFKRNLWMLTSVVPVFGLFVSLGMMIWIAAGISNDPLGRGPHERWVGTRVIETPPKPIKPVGQPKSSKKESVKNKKNKAIKRGSSRN